MDIDRPHRSNSSCSSTTNNTTTSELFICFTSRLSSSSSMKISSKSILSPGRSREPSQISLSTSLSRRLRTNGSMRGGQASPMFPTNTKKRGSFENPEPSSPKVTCIGQVRVKTKKQGKKIRSRSQTRSAGGGGGRGEVSFRRVEHPKSCNLEDLENQFLNHQNQEQQQHECSTHRNQKWVHLPVTICEALRGFGAEFNCFLPCRSSCTASEKHKDEKAAASSNGSSSSCGAVFGRWLVAVQDGSDGKAREIELVVGEQEEEEEQERRRSYRRHVFEEIDFKEEKYHQEHVQEEARVSICVPPKNALLLMRCRSDPVKMAALANKFWEPPFQNDEDDEDKEEQEKSTNVGQQEKQIEQEMEECTSEEEEKLVSCDTVVEECIVQEASVITETEGCQETITDIVKEQQETQIQETPSSQIENQDPESEENATQETNLTDSSGHLQLQLDSLEEVSQDYEEEPKHALEDRDQSSKSETEEESPVQESIEPKEETENKSSQDKEEEEEEEEEETLTHERSESEENLKTQQGQKGVQSKERENQNQPLLPDCLLLMMCEPKLSMEVSKETWVCSTDFIRWLPEPSRPVKKKNGGDHEPKKRSSIDIKFNPPSVHSKLQQPPRSSCSYPAKPPARAPGAESVSTAVEQKLVGSKACEPFMLKRCKSEPVRSAAKLAPENCFWKNRKLEPHCPATLGVGAAGVGC